MAVDALELKPRSAVALYDAAVRLCASSTGVWALTLPGGAAVVAATLSVVDGRSRAWSALWLTLALLVRALCQGAAAHHVEAAVLSEHEPRLMASVTAALQRWPALILATMLMGGLNLLLLFSTCGLGFLVLNAQVAGYAVVMQGKGSVWNLYGTASRILGPARKQAMGVKLGGLSAIIVAFNLQLTTQGLIAIGQHLLGFELTFAERFTELDNQRWLLLLAAITFAVYEPLRAALGALLIIDGRVRQEGLDLAAAAAQLPKRRRSSAAPLIAGALVLASAAQAEPAWQRLQGLAAECELQLDAVAREDVNAMSVREPQALLRFVRRLEDEVFQSEDCETAETMLREGLKSMAETREDLEAADAAQAREQAKALLSREEFQQLPKEPKAEPDAKDDEPSWFTKLLRALLKWLFDDDGRETRRPDRSSLSGPSLGADAVTVIMVALLVVVIAMVALQAFKGRAASSEAAASTEALTTVPLGEGALERPPETWASQADELARQGNYREAFRHLYLALLSRLHRDGSIDYRPTLSNWDYLAHYRGPPQTKAPFRELTLRFDYAWYGKAEVTEEAWREARALSERFLSSEAAAHA